jgi:hypothetical protein
MDFDQLLDLKKEIKKRIGLNTRLELSFVNIFHDIFLIYL